MLNMREHLWYFLTASSAGETVGLTDAIVMVPKIDPPCDPWTVWATGEVLVLVTALLAKAQLEGVLIQ